MEGYSRADPASADLRLVRAFGASAGRWVTGRQFVHNPVLNKAQVPIAGGTFLAPLSWGIGGQAALFHCAGAAQADARTTAAEKISEDRFECTGGPARSLAGFRRVSREPKKRSSCPVRRG
jgi:hypothetical protein